MVICACGKERSSQHVRRIRMRVRKNDQQNFTEGRSAAEIDLNDSIQNLNRGSCRQRFVEWIPIVE
jgi:hypothetical protein